MRNAILTGFVILLAAAPLAKAQPPAKEMGTVSWQYYTDNTALGPAVQPVGPKANIRCSIIASDGEGDWVCLYVNAVPKSTLPDGKNANACRPIAKDGTPFKLTNPALRPESDTTQVVAFVSGSLETLYKLVVRKDGTIGFEIIGPTFAGDTSMSGAASVCWYVTRKK